MKLPAPWRRFFEKIPNIATESEAYQLIANAHESRFDKSLQMDDMENWGADQGTHLVEFQYQDEKILTAKFELLGTYDGETFRWADANKSIETSLSQRAAKFRAQYTNILGDITDLDQFPASIRDIDSLLGLAGQDSNIERTFLGQAYDGRAMAMTLSELKLKSAPAKKSFLGRLLKKEQSFDPLSWLNDHMAQTIARLQPDEKNLTQIELHLSAAANFYKKDAFSKTLNSLNKARSFMGDHPVDTLPAGWLYLCEGWTYLKCDEPVKAQEAFDIASRAISVPDYNAVLLGQARSSLNQDEKQSQLLANYIYSPDWSLKNFTQEETALVKTIVKNQEQKRLSESQEVRTLLKAALDEMSQIELDAMERSEAAAKHRTESHVLCDADEEANKQTAWQWRLFLIKWMTLGRSPNLGSHSSDPDQMLNKLKNLSVKMNKNTASAEAVFDSGHGTENYYEYSLVQAVHPLSDTKLWRLDQVLSVWDDEKIRLH